MNMVKTKVTALLAGAALMFANVAAAATPTESTSSTTGTPSKPAAASVWTGPQTNVNGIWVPGKYVGFENAKIVFVPGGVGIILAAKGIPLPQGTITIN